MKGLNLIYGDDKCEFHNYEQNPMKLILQMIFVYVTYLVRNINFKDDNEN